MRGAIARAVSALALVLAFSAATPTGPAFAGDLPADPETALRAARSTIAPRLADFAAWCNSKGLPRSRDAAWESVLRFDPDHAAARRALHFTRGRNGAWERGKWTPPASEPDTAAVPEFAKRRADAIGSFAEIAFAIAEAPVAAPAAPAVPNPPAAPSAPPSASQSVGAALHEMAVDDLLALFPDDERARQASHETLAPGGWRLDETLRARVRRGEIAAAVASARAALPAQTVAAEDPAAAGWGVRWAAAVQGRTVRVFGGPGTAEAAASCTACDLVAAVYEPMLGIVPLEVKGMTIFQFQSGADASAAMSRDTRFSAADRLAAKELSGWWVATEPQVLSWADGGAARVDAALRQTVGLRLRWQSGVDTRRGWAWEGFGLCFSEAILGSHLTVFAGETNYGPGRDVLPGLADRLRADSSDWLAEGRALERSAAWPDFRVTLGRPVESMTAEEILQGYLLARYLIDGRPADVPAALARLGKGDGPDAWCASALGATVEGLDRRLRRWVRETSGK